MNDDLESRLRQVMAEHDKQIDDNPWSDVDATRHRLSLGDSADESTMLPGPGSLASAAVTHRGSDRRRLRVPLLAAAAVLIVAGGAMTIIGSQTGQDQPVAPSAPSASALSVSGPMTSSEPASPGHSVDRSDYRTAVLMVSWPGLYTSIPELTKDADLVVAGTFGPVATARSILDGDGASIGADVTTRDFTVRQALKFNGPAPTTIQITQTGSIDDTARVITQPEDNPLFMDGETVVLFLKTGAPGTYKLIGGPTGRFNLNGDLVSAYSSLGAPVKDMPLTNFAAQVREAVSASSAPSSVAPGWLQTVATSQAARYGDTTPGAPTWKVMTAAEVMKAFNFTVDTDPELSVTVIQSRGNFTAPRSPAGVERPHGTWLIVAAFEDGRVFSVQMRNTPII